MVCLFLASKGWLTGNGNEFYGVTKDIQGWNWR